MSIRTLCKCVLILVLVLAPLGSTAAPALAQAPTNDDFDSAIVVGGLSFSMSMNVLDATTAIDDPSTCTNGASVWFAFTPSTEMTLEANTSGSDYDTVLSVYTGTRGALEQLPNACDDDSGFGLQSRVTFQAQANTTYYFLVARAGSLSDYLVFNLEERSPVLNDNFANATSIVAFPYGESASTIGSSIEPLEPTPSCYPGAPSRTIWYAFTPAIDQNISARTYSFASATVLAIYTGSELGNLTEQSCRFNSNAIVQAQAGVTYYIQVGMFFDGDTLTFVLTETEPPQAYFGYYPSPSTLVPLTFLNYAYDPENNGITSYQWDFGDGATSSDFQPQHKYTVDGDYTVQFTVTTADGRVGSTSQVIRVQTHDVAITKLTLPKSARAGQTHQIIVKVTSKRYAEEVEVFLSKGTAQGFQQISSLVQPVPIQPGNRTVDFTFSYTFTDEDALIGKVTFQANARAQSNFGIDALPADNVAISPPIKVSGGKGQRQGENEELGGTVFLPVVAR